MPVSEPFKNYIIKKVVKGISLNTTTLKYDYRIELPDAILNEIMDEGATRYALHREDVFAILNDVSKDISFKPLKTDWNNSIEPGTIPAGQHFIIHTLDKTFGKNKLELMCLDTNKFLTLFSDRGTLHSGDMLSSVTQPWNPNYVIDFEVYRNGARFPDKKHYYRTHPILNFEYLKPPPIFEVYDSDDNVINKEKPVVASIEEENTDTEFEVSDSDANVINEEKHVVASSGEENDSNVNVINEEKHVVASPEEKKTDYLGKSMFYYAWWGHTIINSTTFSIDDFSQDKSAVFTIIINNNNIVSFGINPLFKLTDKSDAELAFFLTLFKETCIFPDECDNLNVIKRIITVRRGLLRKTTDVNTNKDIWKIVEKAEIKFIYY